MAKTRPNENGLHLNRFSLRALTEKASRNLEDQIAGMRARVVASVLAYQVFMNW
jgi:hypothetical protein